MLWSDLNGVETCGACGEMESCEKLGAITEHSADALKRLKTEA